MKKDGITTVLIAGGHGTTVKQSDIGQVLATN